MKVNELRIGNIINLGDRVVIVDLAVINRIGNAHYKTTPIPLTEEWFNKFGIFKINDISFLMGCYEIIYSKGWEHWNVILKHGTIAKIKHVHQLQNLYFALTGEELEII